MSLVYLSLGSNLGDRVAALQAATAHLKELGFHLMTASSVYETEPVGFPPGEGEVPWFLNQILCGEWDRTPLDILAFTQSIERQLGRASKTSVSNEGRVCTSRVIDIDLLLVDQLIFQNELLQLPHPRFHARRYDLIPLVEIASQAIHPVFKVSFLELLNRCEALDTVRLHESF